MPRIYGRISQKQARIKITDRHEGDGFLIDACVIPLNTMTKHTIQIVLFITVVFVLGVLLGGFAVFEFFGSESGAIPDDGADTIWKGGRDRACTMEAKLCPDGTYVGRTGPLCEFAKCPTSLVPAPSPVSPVPPPLPNSCKNNSDCPFGYRCLDISPVVREGIQNLRCWPEGVPTPICLSGATQIDTPQGPMNVKDLKKGMMVWTADQSGFKRQAIILKTSQTPVSPDHTMVRLTFRDGREIIVSPGHPTSDGRRVGELIAGDVLDGGTVLSTERIPYTEGVTYDILPEGTTGTYWTQGILLKSTLFKKP